MKARLVLVMALLAGATARAEPDDQARSRALYDQGSRAYQDGDYPRAVELFTAAYELSRAPAILFNIAQAHRLGGDCEQALVYYRRSLAEEPDAANRAEVEERIAEMERCAADRPRPEPEARSTPADAAPAPAAPPRVEARAPAPPRSRRSILPLATVGVGATAALVGGIIYLQARAKFDEVEPTCPCEPGAFSGWETATDVSYLLMGVGTAAAAAGLVWWWRASDDEPARMGLRPTGRGVEWVGSF